MPLFFKDMYYKARMMHLTQIRSKNKVHTQASVCQKDNLVHGHTQTVASSTYIVCFDHVLTTMECTSDLIWSAHVPWDMISYSVAKFLALTPPTCLSLCVERSPRLCPAVLATASAPQDSRTHEPVGGAQTPY